MKKILPLILLTLLSISTYGQATLSGNVTDTSGAPLPGATLVIQDTQMGTTTDFDGHYEIKDLIDGSYQIRVSFIGFETLVETVTVSGMTTFNFMMQESSYQLEGMIVTAQKREQMNKDVPIAITSYGSEFINNQATFEYDAFSEYVPGLQVQIQSVNNPGIVVRGITSDSGDSRAEPRVSVFQDGVSISKSRGSVVELFDLERVEVLKGPQGTLFGRGAQIGAMHIIQNKAKNEKTASLKVGYGNYNQTLINGHVNTTLSDKAFFRFAGIYNARDGFIDNLSGGDLNGKETLAFRTSFKFLFGENTSLDLIGNWQKDTPPGTSFKSGSFAPVGGDISPFTAADLERGEELGLDRTVWGATGILKHHFNDAWSLTATTAYRTFDSDEAFDSDGTASDALFFHEIAKGKQFSQEFRFNFDNNKKFRGFFGLNYFWEDGSQAVPHITNEQQYLGIWMMAITGDPSFFINNGVPVTYPAFPDFTGIIDPLAPFAGAPLNEYNEEQFTNYGTTNAFDVFADGSYDFSDRLTATLGLRLTYEDVTAGYKVDDAQNFSYISYIFPGDGSGNNLFLSTGGEKLTHSDNFLSVVGRLALSYELNDNISVFGNMARGRRPNVINISATETNVLSDEIVWSYEIGGKSLFLNNRLQIDVNGFIYDYSHFQTNVFAIEGDTFVSETRDSGNASATGFEIGTQYAFGKSTLFANYAYIDATFDDEDSDGNEQELAGNTFRLTPKNSFSAGLNLLGDISEKAAVFFRPSYTYKSKVYFEETNLENISQDGYGVLNVRTGLILNSGLEFNLYMNNVLDEEFIIDAGNTGGAFGIPTFIAGPPRFFGLQITKKF